jgi:hypothetical protein
MTGVWGECNQEDTMKLKKKKQIWQMKLTTQVVSSKQNTMVSQKDIRHAVKRCLPTRHQQGLPYDHCPLSSLGEPNNPKMGEKTKAGQSQDFATELPQLLRQMLAGVGCTCLLTTSGPLYTDRCAPSPWFQICTPSCSSHSLY